MDGIARLRSEREAVRAEFGLADDVFVIGTVANFRAQKDYPNLLRVVRALIDQGMENVHLIAVGQGPDAATTAQLVDELDLSASVTLTGFRPDAPRLMAAADVFVLASRWEGLPVAIMEATALGLPIVATAVGGMAEHFNDGRTALLVPPGDSSALADALHRIGRVSEARCRSRCRFPRPRTRVRWRRVDYPHRSGLSPGSPHHAVPGPPVLGSARRPERLSPRLRSGLDIRPATPDDRASILELCRTSLRWGDDPRFVELFSWKHDLNAFGPSSLWVAVDGDQVIGLRAFMKWEFRRGTENTRAVRAGGHRGAPGPPGPRAFTR